MNDGVKGSSYKGDGKMDQAEKLMLQFQGIRSPNSLDILCLTYYKTDNSLRSDNPFYNIAQNTQRKGLPFHRRIHFSVWSIFPETLWIYAFILYYIALCIDNE